MKRINMLVLTIILALIILVIEIIIIKNVSKYEPEVKIIFATQKIKAGDIITEGMVEKRKVSLSWVHSQSVRGIDEIVNKRAKTDIEKDEIILSSRITDGKYFDEIMVENENNRLFTVEFKGDQVNGWQLREGQFVDIIFIPNKETPMLPIGEGEVKEDKDCPIQRVRNVRVAALIDDKGRLVKGTENLTTPKYISFEVDDKLDQFLAYAKGNGRLEISVLPVCN